MAAAVGSLQALFPSSSVVNKQKPAPSYHFFMEKVQWFHAEPTRYTKNNYIKLLENKNLSLARLIGTSFWKTVFAHVSANDLALYSNALEKMCENVLFTHCPKLEGVLEVGSGFLSIIDSLPNFSADLKNKVHLSDLRNSALSHLESTHPCNTRLELDVTQLTRTVSKESYHCIVMRDLLNILSLDDLDKSTQEMFTVLKPGGLVIHLLMRRPYFAPFFDFASKNNQIMFPAEITGDQFTSLFFVNKEELEKCIKTLPDNDQIKIAVSYYLQLHTAEKEEFCALLQEEGIDALKFLSECVSKLNCSSTKKMSMVDGFATLAETSLKKAGFEMIKNESIQSSVIVERNKEHNKYPEIQLFSIEADVREERFMGVMAPDMAQEKITAHLIVARKI